MASDLKPARICDFRDRLVMALVMAYHAEATAFVWLHPTDANFVTWASVTATLTGVYHWINYRDDKTPDTP